MSFNIEWTNADALTPKQFTAYESVPVTYSTTTAPFGDLQREVRAGSSRFELLPCPFCGSRALYEGYHVLDGFDVPVMFCNTCKAMFTVEGSEDWIGDGPHDGMDELRAAWNRRADHD